MWDNVRCALLESTFSSPPFLVGGQHRCCSDCLKDTPYYRHTFVQSEYGFNLGSVDLSFTALQVTCPEW